MKPSSAFSSTAWRELHSLLAEAAPFANTSCLLDAGGAVAAIEMRPRARSFEALLCPAAPVVAKWTAVVFEVDWTLHAAVLKLDRQVVEAKEFRLSQTLELVEFLKSHPFLNSDLVACEGSSNIALPPPPPPSADFIYEKVARSSKCELLLSDPPPPTQPCSNICQFCQVQTAEVKPPPEPKKESGFIANDLDLGSVKLEIQDDDGPYYDDGECYDADDGNDHDWVDDAADHDYDYGDVPRKSAQSAATIFQCGVCGKKYSRRANYTRHMYLHKSHENGENENLAQGEVAGLRIKVESNLASSNVNESGNNAVVKKNGDSAARKKRGPYKSRQGGFTNDVCAEVGGVGVENVQFCE